MLYWLHVEMIYVGPIEVKYIIKLHLFLFYLNFLYGIWRFKKYICGSQYISIVCCTDADDFQIFGNQAKLLFK